VRSCPPLYPLPPLYRDFPAAPCIFKSRFSPPDIRCLKARAIKPRPVRPVAQQRARAEEEEEEAGFFAETTMKPAKRWGRGGGLLPGILEMPRESRTRLANRVREDPRATVLPPIMHSLLSVCAPKNYEGRVGEGGAGIWSSPVHVTRAGNYVRAFPVAPKAILTSACRSNFA